MDFKLGLPRIYINFDIQTKFEVNQTQIGHSILKKTPKTHQSGHMCKSITYIQFCFKNLQSQILQSQILQSQIHANVKTVQEERAHAELKTFINKLTIEHLSM